TEGGCGPGLDRACRDKHFAVVGAGPSYGRSSGTAVGHTAGASDAIVRRQRVRTIEDQAAVIGEATSAEVAGGAAIGDLQDARVDVDWPREVVRAAVGDDEPATARQGQRHGAGQFAAATQRVSDGAVVRQN